MVDTVKYIQIKTCEFIFSIIYKYCIIKQMINQNFNFILLQLKNRKTTLD